MDLKKAASRSSIPLPPFSGFVAIKLRMGLVSLGIMTPEALPDGLFLDQRAELSDSFFIEYRILTHKTKCQVCVFATRTVTIFAADAREVIG